MRRQIMFLAKSVIAVVMFILCIGVPVYASQAGHHQGRHAVRPAESSPWTSLDIGTVGIAGSASSSGDTVTVQGSGTDIWGAADQFQYAYQPLQGDGVLFARVDSQTSTDAWAKAGIMIRNTLNPDSAYAYALVSPGNGVAFQSRAIAGGSSSHMFGAPVQAPYWLELVRSGNTFTAYAASDGQSWTQVGGPLTINMNNNVYIGLAVTSHNPTALSTAVFSNVRPSPNPLTSPLTGPSNLALNGLASASSYQPTFGPVNAIDGSGVTYWKNAPNDTHPWFQVDLGMAYPITEVKAQWLDGNTRTFRVDGSNDGKVWMTVSTVADDSNSTNDLMLNKPAVTRYLRLVIPDNASHLTYKLAEFGAIGGISVPPGPQGTQGLQGPQGDTGLPGAQGSVGPQGAQGSVGPQGAQGPQGDPGSQGEQGSQGPSGPINLALHRPATASTSRGLDYSPNNAVDDNFETSWSPAPTPAYQWLGVDLGAIYDIKDVKLYWGKQGQASSYDIWLSNDNETWTTWSYTTTNGQGGVEDLTGLSGSGRYIYLDLSHVNCTVTHVVGKTPSQGIAATCGIGSNVGKNGAASPGTNSQPGSKSLPGTGKNGTPNLSTNPQSNQNYVSLEEFQVYGNAVGAKGSVGDVGLQGSQGSQGSQGLITPNLALGRSTTASSTLIDSNASNAVDNSINTYWSSNPTSSAEWLQIDLGAIYTVREVKLFWEGGQYATSYQIQVSNDSTFTTGVTTIYSTTAGAGGIDDLTTLKGSGQYIRVNMLTHPSTSVSLAEVQVYGYPTSAAVGW